MNAIVVISLDLPDGQQIQEVLDYINPSSVPHFAGQVRVAVADDAQQVIDWLEGDSDELPKRTPTP